MSDEFSYDDALDLAQDIFDGAVESLTKENCDLLHELIFEIDSKVANAEFTLGVIDDLQDTIELRDWQIWCDGTELKLVCDDDEKPGDSFGLAHEFKSTHEQQAMVIFETFKAGWALRFGYHNDGKLWDGPDEPKDLGGEA